MDPEELDLIRNLLQNLSIRAIARKLGRDVKTIRRALARPPCPPGPSKLEPFETLAREMAAQGLRGPRILREIRARGYTGGRTILGEFLSSIRPPAKSPAVVRRFETRPGEEMQIDWSPYRVKIGGAERVAHCFSMVLCWSRRMYILFARDERLPTLLYAHGEGFAYHGGCARRLVYDNMTQVTLGRLGGKPIWHEHFLAFARHYGFTPYAHRPGHKERSGKVERPFHYVETDFLKGRAFASWDDLNAQARDWLATVANVRTHQTTKRKIDEAWAEEKPLLIALPAVAFGTERVEVRKVAVDGTVCIDGSFYPVPARLVGQHVRAKVWPTRVDVLDAAGAIAATHAVPDAPMRLPVAGRPPHPSQPAVSRSALEAAFLARFPGASRFLDGLKRRMNALTPIHLRQIDRLVALYGEPHAAAAIDRAATFRNYSAVAVARILERAHPNVVPEAPLEPIAGDPAALAALDDMEPASPTDYDFDSMEATDEAKD
jgi:transposase